MTPEERYKWQPLMVVAPCRIECHCGALAVFIRMDAEDVSRDEKGMYHFDGFFPYCQECWARESE